MSKHEQEQEHSHRRTRREREREDFGLKIAVENNRLLREIHHMCKVAFGLATPTRLLIMFHRGEKPMSATLQVGETIIATPVETDDAGDIVAISDPTALAWTGDDAIATGAGNSDGSMTYTAVAPGTMTVTVTDPATGLVGSDTLTVTPATPPHPPAVSKLAIEWSEPAAAVPKAA